MSAHIGSRVSDTQSLAALCLYTLTTLDMCELAMCLADLCEVHWHVLQGYFYYIFGFCFVVGALTVIITIEVAIVTTYVQLCAEDYQWW